MSNEFRKRHEAEAYQRHLKNGDRICDLCSSKLKTTAWHGEGVRCPRAPKD